MDIRTGRTYETRGDAIADGVPESDIAHITERPKKPPRVKFSKNPFRSIRTKPTTVSKASQD